MSSKPLVGIVALLLGVLMLVLFLSFMDIILLSFAIIGAIVCFGVLLIVVLFVLLSIVSVPYFFITKKNVVEQYGDAKLEDVKGKEDQ